MGPQNTAGHVSAKHTQSRYLGNEVRVAEERFDVGAQVAIAEAARQMGKAQ